MMMRDRYVFHRTAWRVSRLVAGMLAGMLAMSAQLAQAKAYRDGNGLTWYYKETSDDSAIIVNDGDNSTFSSAIDPAAAVDEVAIPEKIYDMPVVGIGENAFRGCSKITAVHMPESSKTIDQYAFYGCLSLTNVVIPNALTAIGAGAFWYCSRLPDLTLPASVETVGKSAFRGCSSMTNVTFEAGNAELSIGNSAFEGCLSLTNMTIEPRSGSLSIGSYAFKTCSSLPQVTFGATDGALTVGDFAFVECSSLTNVMFEARDGALSIGDSAFSSCPSLERVAFGATGGALLIGDSAFTNCQRLLAFDLSPDAELKSIGSGVFKGCTSLSGDLVFPATITNVGQSAFYNCENLASIRFAEPTNSAIDFVTIRKSAFFGCFSVTNIYLSQNVAEIEESAFEGMYSLSSVRLPTNLTALADSLFFDCVSLTRIDLPTNMLRTIGYKTFYYSTNLYEFTIPASVEAIGSGAFRGTGFWLDWPTDSPFVVKDGWLLGVKGTCPGDVVLTNVQHVADGAFADVQTLTNLVISGTVQTVGANAFKGCTNLVSVKIDAGVQLDDTAFDGSNWLPTGDGEGEFIDPTAPVVNFNVAFNANGGTGNMATQTFRVGVAKALSTNRFTRALYEFDGWSSMSTGRVVYADGQVVSNLSETAGETIKLYAHWSALTNLYQAIFEANGGSGTMSTQTFAVGQGQLLNTNRFYRSGFVFQGWGLSATGTVDYVDGQYVEDLATNVGATVSLYAHWTLADGEIKAERSGGGVWYYIVATNNTATLVNSVDGQFVGAVDAPGIASLAVPENLGGVPVTAVGEHAFAGCSGVTNIVLPSAVESIGANAFAGCTGLVSVTMPVPAPLFEIMPDYYRRIKRVVVPANSPYFLEADISVCEHAFSNCASLVSTSLPLGMTELPVGVFADCTALVDFEMPYTVETIAERAFVGCTNLTALTVTENVSAIGADAFSGCSSLKIVRYLGDEPETVDSSVYRQANRGLVSGYLKGLRSWPSAESDEPSAAGVTDDSQDEDATDTTSGFTASVASVTWPTGDDGRLLMAWNTTRYSFKKVTLNSNTGAAGSIADKFYVTGRVLGSLPEPEEGTGTFLGWFTARSGGEEVDPYTPVTSAMTVYAHWADAGDVTARGFVEAFEPFYGDDDAGFAFSAATFDGLLIRDGAVAGTIRVKTQAGKYSSAAEGTNSAFTATMQVLGAKKVSLHGVVGADGCANAENEKKGLSVELEFSQFGVSGTYETEGVSYEIQGARDRYSAGSEQAKTLVRMAMANAKGVWGVALPVESADGDGAALAHGHAVLSVTIGAKGKSRVAGTMPDGTRVSVSSALLVGNGCCCLPVVVPLYAGKSGGFAFALWFSWADDGSESLVTVAGCSGWNATGNKAAPFVATFGEPFVGAVLSGALTGTKTFSMDDFFEDIGGEDGFSPNGTEIEMSGTRWKIPRADGVRFSKDDGWQVADGQDYGNPAGLKLTYTAKSGMFKGSFKVFAETDEGKSKKYTATVTGVVVDDVGYGTATIKKIGSVPVKIE